MAVRPKTDILPDGPRKQAARKRLLVRNGIHVRTGLPVVDAKEGRWIKIPKGVAEVAVRGDPRNCGFAIQARKTIPGLLDVEFYPSVAYLIYADRVERYTLNSTTQVYLKVFDLSGLFPAGNYWLTPPSGADAIRRKGERGMAASQRQAILADITAIKRGPGVTVAQLAERAGVTEHEARRVVRVAVTAGTIKNVSKDSTARYRAGNPASKPQRRRHTTGHIVRQVPDEG